MFGHKDFWKAPLLLEVTPGVGSKTRYGSQLAALQVVSHGPGLGDGASSSPSHSANLP